MSKFYSSIQGLQGQRGEATRCGHSGVRASAQSVSGSINVYLSGSEEDTKVSIFATPGSSKHSTMNSVLLYTGSITDLLHNHDALIERLAYKKLEKEYAKGA